MKELKVTSDGRSTRRRTPTAAAHGAVTYACLRSSLSPKRNRPPPSTKDRNSLKLARIDINGNMIRFQVPLCRVSVVGYTWGLFNFYKKYPPLSHMENCILEYPPGAADLMSHHLNLVIHHVLALESNFLTFSFVSVLSSF